MASKGNKGFGNLLADPASSATFRLPPRTGILAGRDNRLAALASGATQTRVHELTDPARCRMWPGHNRDYAALSRESCADLIENLKAQGRQEVPAIVRRVTGDASVDYEVVCGARRHWSITWLRAHDYPDFRFLVEPRELSDEEAFRIADLENRSRADLSDHERAADYARAVDRYYAGSQQRMAERLNVTRSWLSRYLELARLPAPIVGAYAASHMIGISHAARLAPLLRQPRLQPRLLELAAAITAEQSLRRVEGKQVLTPAIVTSRLVSVARPIPTPPARAEAKTAKGRVFARAERNRAGSITIIIPKPGAVASPDLLAGLQTILEKLL